jgi:hypothetical protein
MFGVFSFTDSAIPKGVGEDQIFVERTIAQGCDRCGLIQGLKCDAALMALFVWPNGHGFVALGNCTAERFGSVRSGDATREFSTLGGEHVFEAVDKEFFESGKVWAIAQFRSVEQMSELGTFHGSVYLGRTHH